ncbi:MAG: tetratricopeptide repeat protein [Ignavibacteriae bacterium]|nr:tetratricopeptide repeat protein [Ignavibacteriota bacterium]
MTKPTGNITLLFTDIEGSTRLAQEFPDTLPAALEIHHGILTEAIESNNGFVFEIIGDAFCAAFEKADDAVKAAVDLQTGLAGVKWKDAVIKVRAGIHSGNAEWNGTRYSGYITLARTARVMSVAYGEQIVISGIAFGQLQNKESAGVSFRDLGERRLKDVISPIRLYQIISPGLKEDFPPLKTLDARPNNLPVQLSSFIGREKELKTIKDFLSDTHLLTITGSGGAGKTRLALQSGADVIDDFANGVWLVELAPVSDPLLLPQKLMSVLGVLEDPKESPEKTLTDYLKDKEILILLDNCEHLIDACAILVEKLLIACKKLKVLATSREALRCRGEQIYRIPSLTQPDPEENITPDQLSQYESVRLFIERAQIINRSFRVTKENVRALAEICYQLDGIPLAIELAAARIRILSVEQISERLDDRFSLLKGGIRTALPRQQTLKAMIDWSYDLLSDDEKFLWERLSVFNGGWTLIASEKICSDERINDTVIMELLQNLIEKSIIIFDSEKERYRMLESIRQYSDGKLEDIDERRKISLRHLKYYTDLAEEADPELEKPEIVSWLKILDAERGNFEKGLKFSCDGKDPEAEARLAGALGNYWEIRGQYTEGILRFEEILRKSPDKLNNYIIRIIFLNGKFTFLKGEYDEAFKCIIESHELYKKNNNKLGEGRALTYMGIIFHFKGEYDKAGDYLNEGLAIQRETGDMNGCAESLRNLGIVYKETGDLENASAFTEESLEISRETGDQRGVADSLNSLGFIFLVKGELDKAYFVLEESLEINRETGNKRGIARTLNYLANYYFKKGDYREAVKLMEELYEIYNEIGDKTGTAHSLNNLGLVYKELHEFDKALDYMNQSMEIISEMGNKKGIGNSLHNIGLIHMDKGELDKAIELFEEALLIRRETGNKLLIPASLINLGTVYSDEGKYKKAIEYFREGLLLAAEFGNKSEIAECLSRLLDMHFKIRSDIPLAAIGAFIENYYESNDLFIPEKGKAIRSSMMHKLKDGMSDIEFSKSIEKGKSMKLEKAIEFLLKADI